MSLLVCVHMFAYVTAAKIHLALRAKLTLNIYDNLKRIKYNVKTEKEMINHCKIFPF